MLIEGKKPKVIVLMPAYKAGKRVLDAFARIPREVVDEVIIVDDNSPDDTYALAKTLPATVYKNEKNLGYGGNMKRCLALGLQAGGDIFVELHGDGQYDPVVIPEALQALKPTDGMLIGSRLMKTGAALEYGMPKLKYVVNILLTGLANIMLGTRITEFQSGFRLFTRSFLEKANISAASNDHLFSFETILQALYHRFTLSEIPVVCMYEPGVTQMGWKKGAKYIAEMVWALVRFWLAKAGVADQVFKPRALGDASKGQ